ncbi:MAG: hypothetical protein AAGA21_09000 [Pseudomonadota bacterium]
MKQLQDIAPGDDQPVLMERVLDYLRSHHGDIWSLLLDGRDEIDPERDVLQDINDVIYCLYLLDWPVQPSTVGVEALTRRIKSVNLAGGLNGQQAERTLSVHGTAYTLGALALLKTRGHDVFGEVLTPQSWSLDRLIDPATLLPVWPAKWSHHTWRVSHWVGGSLAILHELWRNMPEACEAHRAPAVGDVLQAVDGLIDERTGVLACYRSRLLQMAFRQAYRLRHDPLLGDIGGVVHVHWVNYAHRRPFKAGERLFDLARSAMLDRWPFMEAVPYCLDFDVVQIVRASAPSDLPTRELGALRTRATAYALDIKRFLSDELTATYGLHKLPGALATMHECVLINPSIFLDDIGLSTGSGRPKDIMSEVAWL